MEIFWICFAYKWIQLDSLEWQSCNASCDWQLHRYVNHYNNSLY